MKFIFTIIPFLISSFTFSQGNEIYFPDYRDGEIYFKFKDNVEIKWKRSKHQSINEFSFLNTIKDKYRIIEVVTPFSFTEKQIPTLDRTFKIVFENIEETDELIQELLKNEGIEFAERVAYDYKFDVPNDENLSEQWSLNKIDAFDAWDIETGSESIDVAIVDDAFDILHEDLAGQIENMWDIANNDGDVSPDVIEDTHGTRVAGVTGASTDNGIGMASIGRNIDLILVKHTTDGIITHGYDGILWAAENGAEIINLSWGGSTYSQARQNLINAVHDNYNVIIVAAAGNDNTGQEHYPAAYDNVIAVAATKEDDTRPDENDWGSGDGSNFGFWIDIAAPGHGIYTTRLNDEYGNSNGTSFSSPMVAGLLGLMWSVDPTIDRGTVVNCLLNSADPITWRGGSGRINAHQALLCISSVSDAKANLEYSDQLIKDGKRGRIGNENGLAEPGEEIELEVEIHNSGTSDASNVVGILSTTDPDITINDNFQSWGDISVGFYEWASDFDFTVSNTSPEKDVIFILELTSDEGSWTENFTVHINSASTSNEQSEKIISVFPTPTEDKLYLKLTEPVVFNDILIYNALGQIVLQTNQINDNYINVSNLKSGSYFIKLILENGTVVNLRFIKM